MTLTMTRQGLNAGTRNIEWDAVEIPSMMQVGTLIELESSQCACDGRTATFNAPHLVPLM